MLNRGLGGTDFHNTSFQVDFTEHFRKIHDASGSVTMNVYLHYPH